MHLCKKTNIRASVVHTSTLEVANWKGRTIMILQLECGGSRAAESLVAGETCPGIYFRYRMNGHQLSRRDLTPPPKKTAVYFTRRYAIASEAIHFLASDGAVSAAFNITPQWFDAPGGVVSLPGRDDEFVGTHAISLLKFDHKHKTFLFANSWGHRVGGCRLWLSSSRLF